MVGKLKRYFAREVVMTLGKQKAKKIKSKGKRQSKGKRKGRSK